MNTIQTQKWLISLNNGAGLLIHWMISATAMERRNRNHRNALLNIKVNLLFDVTRIPILLIVYRPNYSLINYFFYSDNEGQSPYTNQTNASKGPDSDVSWYEKAFAVANNSTSGNKSKFQQLYCNIELRNLHININDNNF